MLNHQDVISKMTLEQKCFILSSKDFWSSRAYPSVGIPSMTLSDGPHGIRKQEGAGDQLGLNGSLPATCFPTAATMANSWDPALGEEMGKYLGEEAAKQDVCVLLGPGLCLKRNPLCGRDFAMAMKASEQSIVLLKNEDNILPLAKGSKVAVIGEFAQKARYQGAGSSVVNCTKLDNTMDVIGNFDFNVVGFEPGYPRVGKGDEAMQNSAVELAKKADYVLLYLGLDEISESEEWIGNICACQRARSTYSPLWPR